MAFLDSADIDTAYTEASEEADQWREDYPEYERLADNGLMEALDENLPEVNEGSLAASLFKLAKRVIKKKLAGRAVALDRDDAWITELANLQWEKKILKNAKSKASPRSKWKDAVRKAAIYGGQPIITLFVTRGNYTGADFIVPYCQDVKLEAGKDSDADSDVIFWDVYYTELQVKNMIEQAEAEMAEDKLAKEEFKVRQAEYAAAKLQNEAMRAEDPSVPEMPEFDEEEPQSYNKWDLEGLREILKAGTKEDKPANQAPSNTDENGVKKSGFHFYIAFQRGVNAPFCMKHPSTKKTVREWSNPDPTGDIPVHYLYCYQDFTNPYGIGIVKLAGGTQNILDYMRQADVLATQLGLRAPRKIKGDETQVDLESLVWAQDALWFVGNADVEAVTIDNGIYQQLPERMSMYQTSLQKYLPTGDTTISKVGAGDPKFGQTPQALKMAEQSLSIDDEDFSENVDETYAAVAASMINTHFANMQGNDLMKLTGEEKELLTNSGLSFVDENGQETNELDLEWDKARATFDFEIDPDADKTQDEEAALEGKLRAYEMLTADPNIDQYLAMSKKRLDRGELLADIFSQLTDNDKIIIDISPEEQKAMGIDPATGQPIAPAAGVDPATGQPVDPNAPAAPIEGEVMDDEAEQERVDLMAIMEEHGVDENTGKAMLAAEKAGFEPDEILNYVKTGRIDGVPAPQGAVV